MLGLWTAGLLVTFTFCGALFIWSGIYNVAASRDHVGVTTWILERLLHQSVKMRGRWVDVPPLNDPDLIRLGAGPYHGGCTACHGAKGQNKSPIVKEMLPAPPLLADAVAEWTPGELFWIVKHGLKYTGMPAWSAEGRDDEVWGVVAFLQKLPQLDVQAYEALAFGNAARDDRSASEIIQRGNAPSAMTSCARCHDDRDSDPTSGLIPRLGGQSAVYMARALREYATGRRASGIMQPVAAELSEAEIVALTTHYERLSSPVDESTDLSDAENIMKDGISSRGIPPCLSCHSGQASASFPLLAGQSAPYLAQQLRLWRHGLRSNTAHGAIMAAIARRLTDTEIETVSRQFAAAGPKGIARIPDARRQDSLR